MKKVVIMPGGFHPFHAGHKALYDAAVAAFPSADMYVAATADTTKRPFPFELKQNLARLAGIPAHEFIQVKSPFSAKEITQMYDPNDTVLIFVRSEKDRNVPPLPGEVKKDGSPSYLQPYKRNKLQPMSQHGYMAYLPVVQFGSGMTSATEIRSKWPSMTPEQKDALITSMYPATQGNDPLRDLTVRMIGKILDPPKPAAPAPAVDEAVVANDPQDGEVIRPTGGLGSFTEKTLVSGLARQLSEIVDMIRVGNYLGVEHLLYKGGVVRSKVEALARYEDFRKKRGNRPLGKGKEIDIGEEQRNPVSDYVDEA
jgi:hypothetical protein